MNRDILVIIDKKNDSISDLSFKIVFNALKLKDAFNSKLRLLCLNFKREMLNDLAKYPVDEIIYSDDEIFKEYDLNIYESAISSVIEKYLPFAVLFTNSKNHKEISARISASLNLGIVADCTKAIVTDDNEDIKWIRPNFDGKLLADIRIKTTTQLATMEGGISSYDETDKLCKNINLLDFDFSGDKNAEILDIVKMQEQKKAFSSDIIVGVGMGIGSKENIKLVEEFAEKLGAELGASKSVCDIGWMPRDRQIGITGTKISPKVYIAIGISGAIQHVDGVDANIFIAINNDKSEPIFNIANYCIDEDLFDVLNYMIKKI